MAEYIIKNAGAGVQDEYYLKEIGKDRGDPLQPVRTRRGRKWKCVENQEEIRPRGQSTATWTKDETQALYFRSRQEAQKLIDRWPVLRYAVIIEA